VISLDDRTDRLRVRVYPGESSAFGLADGSLLSVERGADGVTVRAAQTPGVRTWQLAIHLGLAGIAAPIEVSTTAGVLAERIDLDALATATDGYVVDGGWLTAKVRSGDLSLVVR
jgi:hypothetical protein